MEMEVICLTRTGPGIKNCSVYMVYLQGMSHQFQINVINAFYNKFEITLVNFLNVLVFFLLASKKTNALRF